MSIVVIGATYPAVGAGVVGASVGARDGAVVEPEPEPEPEPVRLLWGEMYCGTSDSMMSKSTDSRDGLVDVTSDA